MVTDFNADYSRCCLTSVIDRETRLKSLSDRRILKFYFIYDTQKLIYFLSKMFNNMYFVVHYFDLVWFYGISTFVGYSMPNPFLYI